ncbi:MAG: S8 family serine peptidase [Actinomycetota bacterium]
MKRRSILALVVTVGVLAALPLPAGAVRDAGGRTALRREGGLPKGYRPAATVDGVGRYFVLVQGKSVAERRGLRTPKAERKAARKVLASQEAAVSAADSMGDVVFRYRVLINGFSAELSPNEAAQMAARPDVVAVQPVSIVRRLNETSVPFIGAPDVWNNLDVQGENMRVAVVDTGIDYTHANFGGPGTVAAYTSNDPTVIEPGTFPTDKVIGGTDIVGENYDVLDDDTSNDTPVPDPDPLDVDGHGSHTAGTCCGDGVPGQIGKGVAPEALLYAIKVWDEGNSTDDVLVAGYEFAVDPNQNGSPRDAVDVLSFSGGVSYGTQNSVEAVAAQEVVDLGTVFVASAGNSGNQPSGFSAYITGTPANAPGVVSAAASIDEFLATTIIVNSPPITLPDQGIMVHQPWSAPLPAGGITTNLFDGRAVDDATTNPADRMFCDPLPAGSLTGQTVLVFKGSTGAGDCDGSLKVNNAAAAGASAVVLVSLFGGLPFALGGDPAPIPAVMISGADGTAILDALSPSPNPPYNDNTVNATLTDTLQPVLGFDDAMTDFTSEGPARLTSALKPDISAPGFNITSTAVGTGNQGTEFSGTSMAAPHVSGVATLLRQLHPRWSPARIKALLMNQATPEMKNNDLSTPVPATVMGAGRVQAFESAKAVSLASPASLSFGLEHATGVITRERSFRVQNFDDERHRYRLTGDVRYSDYDPAVAHMQLSTGGRFRGVVRFRLDPGERQRVTARLSLDPGLITEAEQQFGWYYFNPGVDGSVQVHQSRKGADDFRVPWHVVPFAASQDRMSDDHLDLRFGPDTMRLVHDGVGTGYADLYLLGGTDAIETGGEEDVTAFGARSFTGSTIDGTPEGVPAGLDELAGLSWQDFLTNADTPAEPVEFGVQTAFVHNVTETKEVTVFVDAGNDGTFADPALEADYLVVKLGGFGGQVCVFDLSLPDPFADCTALYFADYSNYNSNLVGLVVDAADIGLTDASPEIGYRVEACTGVFSGDVPAFVCDETGAATLNATAPALSIQPLVCLGFWDGPACDGSGPVTVENGSAAAGSDRSILALFPNNRLSATPEVITTNNG